MKAKIVSVVMLASALAIVPLGCKSNTASTGDQGGTVNITGAGSTFGYPIYSRWFSEYGAAHPGVQINYQSIGSGGGIRQVSEKVVDFGASDGPMTDQQLAQSKVKLIHIPTALGADVLTYNLPGVTTDLNFSPDVIADIYLGHITNWNDPRIAKDNPGIKFPDQKILPVYRSDGSGTTYVFTDYLSKVSPEFAAKIGRNTSVQWPVGVGQKGNEGVAGMIRNSPYSFGYVELVYAVQNKMLYGQVRNAAGNWIKPSTSTVTDAAAAAATNMPADYRVSITNAAGADSYPISSFTWLLIPVPFSTPEKGKVMHDFLEWMLDHGEAEAAGMTYAPLPPPVITRVRETIQQVK
jgi:phosphate transport system substrate-binding protein